MFSKENVIKYQHLRTSHSDVKKKYLCLLYLFAALIFFWYITSRLFFYSDPVADRCSGSTTQNKLCKYVDANQISGNLCMDLCIEKTLYMPQCTRFTSDLIQFYQIEKPEFTIVCPTKNYRFEIVEGISLNEFEQLIRNKLLKYLNYTTVVNELVEKLFDIGDVNRDERINLQEANNLIIMLTNKFTLYQILFSGRSYGSKIKNFCGGCIEIEQIVNQLNLKQESLIQTVLKPWLKWPEWSYRAKISFGILEFFLDLSSLNPNDDFGSNSLYLCQSIESTFGYTFLNEAKLINTDNLLTAEELEENLSYISCNNDSDCKYNDYCSTTCNKQTRRCTSQLQKPQLIDYCRFVRNYLLDNKNITHILEPLLDKCELLKSVTYNKSNLYVKNDLPLSWDKHQDLISNTEYWKKSREFAVLANEIKANLWDWIRHTKDPVKNQKTTKPPETTTITHLAKKN